MRELLRPVAEFLAAAFQAIVAWVEMFLWSLGHEWGIAWVFVLALVAAAMAVWGLRARW